MASPDGKRVYVAEFGSNQIGVVDTSTDTRLAGFVASADPGARTYAVWVSGNRFLYAANSGADTIAKLDARTGQMLWELPVGDNPSEVLVTADDRLAFVSVRSENTIKIVDTRIPAVVAEQPIDAQPDTLQLTNDGQWLTVALRSTPARMMLLHSRRWRCTRSS